MKAGFAETVITPPDGRCVLAGYFGRWSTGVHDDLYASAVSFQDGDTKAVLIGFDLIGMHADLISKLKESIQEAVSVDRNRILFTCTHTHEGPQVRMRGPARRPVAMVSFHCRAYRPVFPRGPRQRIVVTPLAR